MQCYLTYHNTKAETIVLIKPTGENRSSDSRNAIKNKYKLKTAVKDTNSKAHVDTDKLLTRTRYKNYRKFWDDYESDDAYAEFDEVHKAQGGIHDTEDDEIVALADISTIVRKRKRSSISTKEKTEDIDEPTFKRWRGECGINEKTGEAYALSNVGTLASSHDQEISPDDSISQAGASRQFV